MPKKPVRNAFYFFMKELEPALRKEGRVFVNGIQDVVPIAHPRWKALPEKEKERFEKMAKEYKKKMRGAEGDKFRMDNVGNNLAYRVDPVAELNKRRLGEQRAMRSSWPPGKEVAKEKFYFINIQYLCKTEEDEYLPCEIAIIEYSIESGITKKLHRFIEPGRIKTGYRFTCIENSEQTHQIPVENFELSDSNYRGLWIQIENFINPQGELPEHPPLYCLGADDDYRVVEYCLDWIHGRTCLGTPNCIRKIYEVEGLLLELNAHIGNSVAKSQCVDLLTSHDWDYEPDTKCDYHEEKEVKHCSLGIVQRYAFAMSDCLCGYYDVQLTPKHLPMRKDTPAVTVLSPSTMPVDPHQDSRMPQRKAPPVYNRPKAQPTRPVAQDDDDDEDYTPLRLPGNAPGTNYNNPAPWAGMMGVAAPKVENSFTPMGRGLSIGMEGLTLNDEKFAGRSQAPDPTFTPNPPMAWQRDSQPLGIGRGLLKNMPEPKQEPVAPPMLAHPPHIADTDHMNGLNGQIPHTALQRGRGRGGILEHLMKTGVKPGVPQGRGIAPPDWVDDGSFVLRR